MVDPQVVYDFYDRRIPSGIFNGPLFEKWRRKAERDDPQLLFMSKADLMQHPQGAAVSLEQFPDALTISGARLPLEYHLEPGDPVDGVTMIVPVEALSQVHEERAEWLVPGLLREKVIALIKSLPKHLRVNFVPAPDYADSCLKSIEFGEGSLREQIASRLARISGVEIPPHAWNPEALPDYLRMNFSIVDAEGKVLGSGRDLNALKHALGRLAAQPVDGSVAPEFHRSYITTWDFGDLPEHVHVQRGGISLYRYPAVIDKGESVDLTLLDSAEAAAAASRAGIRRLFVLQVRDELAMHIEYLPGIDEMCLHFSPLGSCAELKQHLIDLVADRVFIGEMPAVRSQLEFERRARSHWSNLWPAANEVSAVVARILAAYHKVDLQLAGTDNPFWTQAIEDIRAQLAHLMSSDPPFLLNTPYRWLLHYPRYLQGIQSRLNKLASGGLMRDQQATVEIAEYWQRYQTRHQRHTIHGIFDPALEHYRWMIEEMRISLFAQELRTFLPVSAKRMENQWAQAKA